MKYPSMVDVPVMILFFNRPDTLQQVFNAVKKARPSTLLLVQDGAREGREGEEELVLQCRNIVEDINWECTVYRNYSDINLSCDHREFTGISWAFEHVDRLIILEDDCVPCPSFFPFCEELLRKYENDTRVDRICGFNRLEKYEDISADYFFSTIASGYGWATWKRVWKQIERESSYDYLDNEDLPKIYNESKSIIADKGYGDILGQCSEFRQKNMATNKFTSWENIVGVHSLINHSLVLTPKYNMIKNIGAVAGSTHYSEWRYVNSSVKRLLLMDTYDVVFPLRHPYSVMRDVNYEKKHYKLIHKSPIGRLFLKFEVATRRLIDGDFKGITKAISRVLKKGK